MYLTVNKINKMTVKEAENIACPYCLKKVKIYLAPYGGMYAAMCQCSSGDPSKNFIETFISWCSHVGILS